MLRGCIRLMNCGEWLGYLNRGRFHTNAAKILFSTFDKDLPIPTMPTPMSKAYNHDTDILLEQLRKARTIERILDISVSHLDVMNAQHIVALIESMHELTKEDSFDPKNLLENQTFQSICSRLMKIVRLLDSQELITVYKVLAGLGIRNNSYVMQSVLKMIGGHLNDMNLGQITFLSFLLSKQRHNPLVDGLRLALPLVLQVQMEQQLDSDNMSQVADCLQLACRARLKPVSIQKIVDTILDKAKSLSPNNATTVIFSLLNLDTPVEGYKQLLNYSFELVTKNIELVNQKQLLSILKLCRMQSFYHSSFFFEMSKKVVLEKWNLENTWEVLKMFNLLSFCPPDLMDHFVSTLCLEADAFRKSLNYSLLSCVEFLTATGYQSPHLSAALRVLCSCENRIDALCEKSPNLLVKFVSCLAIMGWFPENLLSRVLNEDFLFQAWSKSRKQGRGIEFERNLFSLLWSFEVYEQKDRFSFPGTVLKSLTQAVCQRCSKFECPLQKFIENGLGGSQFLQSGVFTHDGLLIDHVLAMRSGNYPVSLHRSNSSQPSSNKTESLSFVEDFVLPADAKIVSVIVAHEDQYCKDPEVLRGWMELKIKVLAKKKYSPVVINYTTWRNLPDREKIPFLMHEIKLAVQEEPIGKSNSLF